jgi:hypothetical protein
VIIVLPDHSLSLSLAQILICSRLAMAGWQLDIRRVHGTLQLVGHCQGTTFRVVQNYSYLRLNKYCYEWNDSYVLFRLLTSFHVTFSGSFDNWLRCDGHFEGDIWDTVQFRSHCD